MSDAPGVRCSTPPSPRSFCTKRRGASTNWRRSVDYYPEGELLWLDADMTIRSLTNGKKSLDDFTRAFYGGASGHAELKPYTFDDIVTALNAVAPHDWRALPE